jgi:hypothetical protein
MLARGRAAGDALDDAYARLFELAHFIGIIGEETYSSQAERFQRFRSKFIFAVVGREAELPIGFDGIESLVLELIGFNFVDQADAAALLRQIEHDTRRFFRNFPQGKLELRAAVTPLRSEDVSGEALGVKAHERSFRGC